MNKLILLFSISIIGLQMSCKQDGQLPTEEEMAQKVQDKYGAELATLQELKKMQCDETINQKVSERLSANQTSK